MGKAGVPALGREVMDVCGTATLAKGIIGENGFTSGLLSMVLWDRKNRPKRLP
jgi:hypothetical protein